jgi:DNA-binding transcriptional ArsR family regulator
VIWPFWDNHPFMRYNDLDWLATRRTCLDSLISESSRRHILDELRNGEQPVHVLVERLAISQPAISKHLRVLRDAGLVKARPDGQRRLYSVCPEAFLELDAWLEPYRQMWRESLDKLEQQVSRSQSTRRK